MKGQIAGQVFIYIMAVVVIGGIAIIGYGAITKITAKSCQAEKASFNNDIEGLIEKYTSYGSLNKKTIKVPCDYDTICFIETSKIGGSITCSNSIIKDSAASGSQQNIFVISNKATIPIGYSDLISLNASDSGKCLCIKQRNKNFYITFNGKGSTTELSAG